MKPVDPMMVLPTVVVKVEILGICDSKVNVRVTNVKGQKLEAWLGRGGTITYDSMDVPGDAIVDCSTAAEALKRISRL